MEEILAIGVVAMIVACIIALLLGNYQLGLIMAIATFAFVVIIFIINQIIRR